MTAATSLQLDPLTRLSKDLKNASTLMSAAEARYLVDAYYQIQEYRKASANQVRSQVGQEPAEPTLVLDWLFAQTETLEGQIKRALDAWTGASEIGQWAKSITGIGPVITAGLMANIDISKAPTAGHIWRFAGLDPTQEWGKGQKRPWNARLKTLCWKIGESFVKVSNNKDDFYGKVYQRRKELEIGRNDASEFAAQAQAKLQKFKIGQDTEARKHYESGKLPPAHIHSRAKRYAVKLFLAHYQYVAWVVTYGEAPVKPYVIEHLGHAHLILPPNFQVK